MVYILYMAKVMYLKSIFLHKIHKLIYAFMCSYDEQEKNSDIGPKFVGTD